LKGLTTLHNTSIKANYGKCEWDPEIHIIGGDSFDFLYGSKKVEESHLRRRFSYLRVSCGIHFGIIQDPEPICLNFWEPEDEKKYSFCIGD
jgi:hypothetical protein